MDILIHLAIAILVFILLYWAALQLPDPIHKAAIVLLIFGALIFLIVNGSRIIQLIAGARL